MISQNHVSDARQANQNSLEKGKGALLQKRCEIFTHSTHIQITIRNVRQLKRIVSNARAAIMLL